MKEYSRIIMLLLGALLSISFAACSSEDADGLGDRENGSANTTDVAVTGAVQNKNYHAAEITGYVNLDKISSSYTSYEMGIQICRNPNFESDCNKYTVKSLEGNKLTVYPCTLNPATTYYFRTYVYVNSHYFYGAETRSFTTDDFSNIVSSVKTGNISFNSVEFTLMADTAQLKWGNIKPGYNDYNFRSVGIVLSTRKSELNSDSLSANHVYGVVERFRYIKDGQCEGSWSGLESNTTYYYCPYTRVGDVFRLGDISSFTTKDASSYITTWNASNISGFSATVTCSTTLCDYLSISSIELGVKYRKKGDTSWQSKYNSVSASNPCDFTLTNLDSNTTYEYCAYAYHDGYVYGTIKTFTTSYVQYTTTLPDWTSTNHTHGNTETRDNTLYVKSGAVLSFSYTVSTEYYDYFKAYIIDADGYSSNIISDSGSHTGTCSYTFYSGGVYTLRLQYSKDGSDSYGSDNVVVTNIKVTQ